ncbi:MAG: AsmA family protein [Phenylobacterium sp.]
MTHEPLKAPKPAPRRKSGATPARRAETGERRPLARAGDWTREHWAATRARIASAKPPSKKTMYTAGSIVGVLAVVVALLIIFWDWNWFRGPVARYASAKMHREVTIAGDLNVHLWSWQPSATIDKVRIANPAWAGQAPMAEIGRIAVQIRLLPLFAGHVDLRLLEFDQPNVKLYRNAKGQATWDFSDGKKTSEPLRLPPIRKFVIEDGKLSFRDEQRKLTFSGSVNATEKLGVRNHGFEMTGAGRLNAQPFHLQVTGGPLLNIERDKPYPFDADIRAGDTYVSARGAVPKPFDMGQFYMNTTARGPDMADLYGLTGIALPNTPPYRLNGRLSRDENLWRIDGIGGRVGDSDLAGSLSVKVGGERPFLTADLKSKSLDFDDLGAIFGGAPAVGAGETASAGQKVMARKLNAEQRLLPDATLKVDRIRALDADVKYQALSIRDAPIHLRSASARVKLDAGMLKAEPVAIELPKGRVAGRVYLDARKATPVTDMDLRLTNARIEDLIPATAGGGVPITGALMGRARLTGAGDSVHKAFANADGEVMLVVPGGEIREAFAELMGINVTKGLGLLMSKNQDKVPIRCAVAHFDTKRGVMTADRIVFDTGPVLGEGSGTVNLGTERMDFRLKGHAKEFRLVRLMAPITMSGPIKSPKLGVEFGGAIAQGGIATVLATMVNPLLAILPFIDPGMAKDANCGALVAEARAQGAPVTATAAR